MAHCRCKSMHCCWKKSCGMRGLSAATATEVNSGVVGGNVLEAFALPHQRPLQDDTALLVALAFLGGKLIHPAELAVAVLAADVPHHVSSCQHDSVLNLAVLQIHNLEGSSQMSDVTVMVSFLQRIFGFFKQFQSLIGVDQM